MPRANPGDVTRVLDDVHVGRDGAEERLLSIVYDELHTLADGQMRRERANHTLQPTALVHEAYLRLLGDTPVCWENRAHFYGAAAEVMRRILVDHARARLAAKRGGGGKRDAQPLGELVEGIRIDPQELLAIDEALTGLEAFDREKSRIVQLRFFGGLSHDEIAGALDVSVRTVKRQWRYAKAWLYREIGRE